MTTRRGEPIETKAVDVAAILRPLVESDENRFEALRLGRYQDAGGGAIPGWRIDASVDAIVRAAAACGLKRMEWLCPGPLGPPGYAQDQWQVRFADSFGFGSTLVEAAARALVAAWNDEKATRLTGARAQES